MFLAGFDFSFFRALHYLRLPVFLMLSSLLYSCSNQDGQNNRSNYNLESPVFITSLPNELKEISGLAVYKNDEIICEQDERGSVYFYDLAKRSLTDSLEFGKDQDYEGIAKADSTIYILKSNGNIFEIDGLRSGKTFEYKTFLNRDNDTEGLCYDSKNTRLLIACKGSPDNKLKAYGVAAKAIYAFDLETKTFGTDPAYFIYADSVKAYIEKSFSDQMKEMMKIDRELFAPSEIAINPVDNNLYVLCSVGKLLIVLSNSGAICNIYPLNPKYFRHPEGITFYDNGDMLISNEGNKNHSANIMKFDYVK